MVRVVVGSLNSKQKGRSRSSSVLKKRVRRSDGDTKLMMTIDAGSLTFGRDFQDVFKRNVAKARRENKKVTGSNDGVPKG